MRFGPKIFHVISLLIFICAIFVCFIYTISNKNSHIDDIIKINLLIITSVGAIISTMYSLINNHLAWKTFQGAMQPSVLFRLKSVRENGISRSWIDYRNTTNHDMRNVTVHITVEVGDQKYDYSGLFRKNFLLPAKDERQRIFDNIEEFKKHNITSDQILESPETTLTIGYEYTHYNKIVKVEKQQEYKWDENIGIWIIK